MLGVCTPNAFAARPFVTDDARLTTAGSCQLESWARFYRDSREIGPSRPATPPATLKSRQAAGMHAATASGRTIACCRQKTLFRPLETNSWGFGLGVGTVRHPKINPGPNLLGNTYVYLPVSFSFNDDRLIVYQCRMAAGPRKQRRQHDLGYRRRISGKPRLLLIAETFGDHRNQPYWQQVATPSSPTAYRLI